MEIKSKQINIIKSQETSIPGVLFERAVVVPENITVHLGSPNEIAENITLPFINYIENVASSELYPTWPENALIANIHAIVSIALNRIFTNWYRIRGYNFDITNSTQYDQAFVVKTKDLEPTGIVDAQTWESIYRNSLGIIRSLPPEAIYLPYFRYVISYRPGDKGPGVFIIQQMLRYISLVIPEIPNVELTEIFDEETKNAVFAFQTFYGIEPTGVVDETTWNAIVEVYRAQKYGSESLKTM